MTWPQDTRWRDNTGRGDRLPSYRQIDRWCRLGVLGDEHKTRLGSGFRRVFSSNELDRLERIASVDRCFHEIGFRGLPLELVARLWVELALLTPVTVVRAECDGVDIMLRIPHEQPAVPA